MPNSDEPDLLVMSSFKDACSLKLYVAGETPASSRAIQRLRNILEQEFPGSNNLKVIDVLKNPRLAEEDNIRATPTLIRDSPSPALKFIGDFFHLEDVLRHIF